MVNKGSTAGLAQLRCSKDSQLAGEHGQEKYALLENARRPGRPGIQAWQFRPTLTVETQVSAQGRAIIPGKIPGRALRSQVLQAKCYKKGLENSQVIESWWDLG